MSKSMTIFLLVLGNLLAYSINAAVYVLLSFLPNFILYGFFFCLIIAVSLGNLSSKIAVSCKKLGITKKLFYLASFTPTFLAAIIASNIATSFDISHTNPFAFLTIFFYAFPAFILAFVYILSSYFCLKSLERSGKY